MASATDTTGEPADTGTNPEAQRTAAGTAERMALLGPILKQNDQIVQATTTGHHDRPP